MHIDTSFTEHRAKAIEVIAGALYKFDYAAAGGLETEKKWAIGQGLKWPTASTMMFYQQANVIIDALGAARFTIIANGDLWQR
jgi:hypothetical protein